MRSPGLALRLTVAVAVTVAATTALTFWAVEQVTVRGLRSAWPSPPRRHSPPRSPPCRPARCAGCRLARALVEAHGGRIWVESAPGTGACFHVELPGYRP